MKLRFTNSFRMITAFILLLSCGTQSKKISIVGTWEYERVEKATKTTATEADKMDRDNKGHTVQFDADGKYVSLRAPTDTTETGSYEVINDGKFVVTHRNGSTSGGDTVKIAELTSDRIKVQTPNDDIYILKRVQ